MPGLGSVSTGLLHQEISRLNGLLEEKMRECDRLDRQVDDIRRQSQERVQTLEQQVGASLWCHTVQAHLAFHVFENKFSKNQEH